MYFKIQSITWNHIYLVARNCWVSWKTANARRERPDCLHHSQDHFLGTACSELSSSTGLTLSLSTPVPYDLMLPLFPPLSFSWCIFPFGKPWESAPLTQLLPALPEGQHCHFQNDCLPPPPGWSSFRQPGHISPALSPSCFSVLVGQRESLVLLTMVGEEVDI